MVLSEDTFLSPLIQKGQSQKQQSSIVGGGNGGENGGLFSPRFRSVAEMAGWDEESLLIASLVVEDTPERESKHKKRSDLLNFRTPPSNSRRKRRVQKKSPVSIPVTTLDLDEVEVPKNDVEKQKKEVIDLNSDKEKSKKVIEDDSKEKGGSLDESSSPAIPCIDRLREELSCAICLDICYEPSTTSCGHSFCKKCLRSASERCGKKCPKCRQLISNGRSCTINTVLWNTIQLLFPQEIEVRKAASEAAVEAAGALNNRDTSRRTSPRVSHYNARNGTILALNSPESEERRAGRRRDFRSTRSRTFQPSAAAISDVAGISNPTMSRRRRDLVASQDGDAALALRLQREEFMDTFRGRGEGSSLTFARANLRAMASRAMDTRTRRSRESS
ncbi:hypothetical protein LIER_18412 [Lithospermum erythrorhizon]|uniref:RING-type E3 ubiquitin transferase n=1 Tax=Lithospermum erythrorhizon TaxID=34254 RepID=A0AAV3QID3_LITER